MAVSDMNYGFSNNDSVWRKTTNELEEEFGIVIDGAPDDSPGLWYTIPDEPEQPHTVFIYQDRGGWCGEIWHNHDPRENMRRALDCPGMGIAKLKT